MKNIVLHKNNKISFDDEKCFKNEIEVNLEERLPENAANDLKQEFISSFFTQFRENIVVLSAAGTSMDNGSKAGMSREDLWNHCKSEIDELCKVSTLISTHESIANKDIEAFLSRIKLYEKLNGQIPGGFRVDIEKKIVQACDLTLDLAAPHLNFLNKITSRKVSAPRVKIFTLNYDTLFEQAANRGGYTVIDGFSYVQPRKFSGRYFDIDFVNRYQTRINKEESFEPKVFHLYKLHGSLTWERNGNDISMKSNPADPLIIYPADEKYESSYEQPYFEMMSRFQQSLRKEDTILFVIGFGFMDKHIQNVIIEAVEQNPSFHLVIIQYNKTGQIDPSAIGSYLKPDGNAKDNVTVIFDTFSDFTARYPLNKTYFQVPSS